MTDLLLTGAEERAIRHALIDLPKVCRFHGDDLEKSGMSHGFPRCESCRIPWRAREAWTAYKAAIDRRDDAVVQEPAVVPCPEGYHYMGQRLTHCSECGLPPWEHAGRATLPKDVMSGSFNPFGTASWVLDPWKPGEAEALRQRVLHTEGK